MSTNQEDAVLNMKVVGLDDVVGALRKMQAEQKKAAEESKRLSNVASFDNLKKQLKESAALLKPAVGAFSFVAITKGFMDLVGAANAFAKSMGAMAKMTGFSTQELSVWGYMAKRTGKDVEDLQKPLIKAAQFIGQVNLGDKTARSTVAQLFGGNDKALDGLSQDQQLEKITKRMAALGPSAERTAMAMKMFGKSGAELLPFIDKFGKNLDEWKQKAADAGMVVGPELAASIAKSKEAMVEMKMRSQGVAMQFSAGLMPALAKASMGLVSAASTAGEVGAGFKTLGTILGGVAKVIVSVFVTLGAVVGTILGGLWDGLTKFVGRFTGAIEDIKAGNYLSAAKKIGSGLTYGLTVDMFKGLTGDVWNGFGTQLKKDLAKIWGDSKVDPALLEEGVVPKIGKEKAAKAVKDWTDEIARARKAAAEAQIQAEKAVADERIKLEEDEAKRQYEMGALSVEEYYRGRREALAKQSANAMTSFAGRYGDILGVQNVQLSEEELLQAATGSRATLQAQSLTGKEEVQRLEKISELSKLIGEIEKQQLVDKKGKVDLERQEANDKFKYASALANEELNRVKLKQQAEEDKYARGTQSRFTTDQAINALGAQSMPQLQALADQMRASAVGREQVAAAEQFAQAIRDWGAAARETNIAMMQLKTSVADLMVTGITDFFMNFATQEKSVGEAALDMAQNFIQSILQMITQAIVMKAVYSMFGMATPARSLASAFFSTGGAVQKKAAGGAIYGPGTGTSDSIPAMLSNGEHVWTAAEVRAAGGHEALYALRASVMGRRYAEGGAVGAAAGAGLLSSEARGRMEVGLEPGLVEKRVDRHLSTMDGFKVVVDQIGRHAKKVKGAMG